MARSLRDKRINHVVYISLGVIAVIVVFIIFFNIFGSRSSDEKFDVQVSENNSSQEEMVEETNSSIGRTVEELEDSDEEDEWQAVQVTDDIQAQEELAEDLNDVDYEEINESDNIQNIENSNKIEVANNTIETTSTNTVNQSDNLADTNEDSLEVDNQEEEEMLEDPTFFIPVEGEISKQYGKEKLIYSDTLKEWTTHLGIDIKADKTTVVKASADGTVKSIKNDPRYGLTVVIEHQNGFTSVYSNLLTAEFVVVGEDVKAGQTLGTVGNSATFEILDDSHLHFEILKDGNSVDPEMYIK